MTNKGRYILLVSLLSVVCVFCIIIGTAATVSYLYRDLVKPNTLVSGLSVGGLTYADAYQKITEHQTKLLSTPVKVQYNDVVKTFSASDFQVTVQTIQINQALSQEDSLWSWIRPDYWRDFFRMKEIALPISYDKNFIKSLLEQELSITNETKNASLKVENGELVVASGQSGYSINVQIIAQELENIFKGNQPSATVVLKPAITSPLINEEQAERTKQELTAKIKPIVLSLGEETFTISQKDQYQFLDFNNGEREIKVSVNQDKIKAYISDKIAKKFNIKMESRLISSDTREVISEGKEGREVQTAELLKIIHQQISQFQYSDLPTDIPTKTIAVTEKIKYPSFVAGLYEGKYIYINLAEQKMYLMEGQNQVASFLVSTGKWSMPTPKGTVYVRNKISFAFSRSYGVWMPWWLGLSKNPDGTGYLLYGIHELPCYNRNCTIREGANHLGRPVSHGCIRLGIGPANTVYNWAEEGMPVSIN